MARTPDEIKKGLSCCGLECADRTARCRDGCPYYPECDFGQVVVEDAISCIQQLQAENAQQARCIENLTDKLNATNDALPRWISVEERLPEDYISVIGYLPIDDKEGFPPTREVYRTEKGWFAPSLGELCIVTHWMYMPEGFREV